MSHTQFSGISLSDSDDAPSVTIQVSDAPDDEAAAIVARQARLGAVKAMRALDEDVHPDDVEGALPPGTRWDAVIENEEGDT